MSLLTIRVPSSLPVRVISTSEDSLYVSSRFPSLLNCALTTSELLVPVERSTVALLVGTTSEIPAAKVMEIARKSSTPKTCEGCELVKRCTNSCGCANRMNTGDENTVSPLQCTYERMLIEVSDALGEELYSMDPVRFAKEFG